MTRLCWRCSGTLSSDGMRCDGCGTWSLRYLSWDWFTMPSTMRDYLATDPKLRDQLREGGRQIRRDVREGRRVYLRESAAQGRRDIHRLIAEEPEPAAKARMLEHYDTVFGDEA